MKNDHHGEWFIWLTIGRKLQIDFLLIVKKSNEFTINTLCMENIKY